MSGVIFMASSIEGIKVDITRPKPAPASAPTTEITTIVRDG